MEKMFNFFTGNSKVVAAVFVGKIVFSLLSVACVIGIATGIVLPMMAAGNQEYKDRTAQIQAARDYIEGVSTDTNNVSEDTIEFKASKDATDELFAETKARIDASRKELEETRSQYSDMFNAIMARYEATAAEMENNSPVQEPSESDSLNENTAE